MTDKLRIGVVGANVHEGWGGRVHVPVYQALPDTEVVAICNSRIETAQESCRHFGVEQSFDDFMRMVQLPEIDVVSISTRVSLHHPIAIAALNAGKHVFCEWPLAVTSEQAGEMLAIARAHGLVHGMDAQARGAPPLIRMRELVEEGYVGRLLTFTMNIVSGSAMTPRAQHHWWLYKRGEGGDALTIPCGHAVDLLQWCLGKMVQVSGITDTLVKTGTIAESGEKVAVTSLDTVAFSALLGNGAVGSVFATSAAVHSTGWRLEAYGTEGSLIASTVGGVQTSPIQLSGARNGETIHVMEIPDRLRTISIFPENDVKHNVAVLVDRFTRAVRGDGAPSPDFSDGEQLHQVLEAVIKSSEEGRSIRLDT